MFAVDQPVPRSERPLRSSSIVSASGNAKLDQVAVVGGVAPLPQRRRIGVRPALRRAVVGHAVRQPVGGSVVVGDRRAEVVRHLQLVGLRHVERVVADSALAQGSDHHGAPTAIVGIGGPVVSGIHEDVGRDRASIDAVLVRRALGLRLHGGKRRAWNEREELVTGPVVELVVERATGAGVGAAFAEAPGLEGVQHAVVGARYQHLATEAVTREVAAIARVAGLVIGALGAVAVEIAHPEGHVHRTADHDRVGVEEIAQQELDGRTGGAVEVEERVRLQRERRGDDGVGCVLRRQHRRRAAGGVGDPEPVEQIGARRGSEASRCSRWDRTAASFAAPRRRSGTRSTRRGAGRRSCPEDPWSCTATSIAVPASHRWQPA